MDAFENIRGSAAALHAKLVAKGFDPAKPFDLAEAAAADQDVELAWLAEGDPALKGARALYDEQGGVICCVDRGTAGERACLVAHEIDFRRFCFAPLPRRRKIMKRILPLWLGLLAFAAMPALAQQGAPTGQIHGQVTNPTGAPQSTGTVTVQKITRAAAGTVWPRRLRTRRSLNWTAMASLAATFPLELTF